MHPIGQAIDQRLAQPDRKLDHTRIVPALPELLRVAVAPGDPQPNKRSRIGILAVQKLVAAESLGQNLYAVCLVVRIHDDGQRFHDPLMTSIDPVEMAPDASATVTTAGATAIKAGNATGTAMKVATLRGHLNKDMLRALSIPAGARWITVRPIGPGSEGHPVLIQPGPDGDFRVIGGADCKLN